MTDVPPGPSGLGGLAVNIKSKKENTMPEYTIVMLYPDYIASQFGETYQALVKAETIEEAIAMAQDEAAQVNELNTVGSPEDFAVTFACIGHFKNLV